MSRASSSLAVSGNGSASATLSSERSFKTWVIDQIEINGGFLPGLKLRLPPGLTCIIGPRGSGKSTLAELLRFAIRGAAGAPKQRTDLLSANLGTSGLVTITTSSDSGPSYTIRRALKQPAVLLTADGRTLPNVDLDRGTFLPLDFYTAFEIENIADETLGNKRRALLDELRVEELSAIHLSLSDRRRTLEENADRIKAVQRAIANISEQIEELGGVRAKLDALGPAPEDEPSSDYTKACKQQQYDVREARRLDAARDTMSLFRGRIEAVQSDLKQKLPLQLTETGSSNCNFLSKQQTALSTALTPVLEKLADALKEISESNAVLLRTREGLQQMHAHNVERLGELQEAREAADELSRARAELEQQVADLEQLENEYSHTTMELEQLLKNRQSIKAGFLLERERVSTLRELVAAELQQEVGSSVRVRMIRNADDLAYRTCLIEGLKGARVRNHDEILDLLLQLRPEQLSQIVQDNDAEALEELCTFGAERSQRILEAFRQNVDVLAMETVDIEDQVRIELNVASAKEPIFKDAAELSRGQKCTALLPLLLARQRTPLIIDQPEDNLDNHFIYETVVNSVAMLKQQRQMIFITHNANLPVLAEADLIIVMSCDGKIGYVQQSGSVDQCKDHIVDLLEGGAEAFELRRKRYARV